MDLFERRGVVHMFSRVAGKQAQGRMLLNGGKKWKPNLNQRRAMKCARAAGWQYDVADFCRDVGIGVQTYYGWFKSEEFRRWWRAEWERLFVERVSEVWMKVLASACGQKNNCSQAHAKLILERFDKEYGLKGETGGGGPDEPLKAYLNLDVAQVAGRADDESESSGQ